MTYQPQAIIITPEQIVAIAQSIAHDQERDIEGQCSPDQWQAATEHWLRARINGILIDVDWHARSDFQIEPTCEGTPCQRSPLPHSIYCGHHTEQAIEDGVTGRTVPVVPTVAPLTTETTLAVLSA